MNDLIYKVHDDCIEFVKYPFKCSNVCKNRILKATDIIDATEKHFAPQAVRTISNELIFLTFMRNETDANKKLPRFFKRNNVTVRKSIDVWSIINDPFLDTEHSPEYIESGFAQLEKCGIVRGDCHDLRIEIAVRMLAYNAVLRDWVHLGLYDTLRASLGYLSGEKYRLSDKDFEKIYWRAMKIAMKGFD